MKKSVYKTLALIAMASSVGFPAAAYETHTQNGDTFNVTSYILNPDMEGGYDSEDAVDLTDGKIPCNPGDVINLYFTLTRRNSADFTNVQYYLEFPEGVHPYYNTYEECYGWAGDDCLSKKGSYVSFADNFDRTDFWPSHGLVGTNSTKKAITANPCKVYAMTVKVDEDAKTGDVKLTGHTLKYTSYDDDAWHTLEPQDVCVFSISSPVVESSFKIYSDDILITNDSQCELKVKMKNENAVSLWQTDITLPAGFTVATDSWGDPAVSVSGNRTSPSRHNITVLPQSSGALRLMCSSTNNYNFLDNDGEVATIQLNVASHVASGKYPVRFTNGVLSENNGTSHRADDAQSWIEVVRFTLGDVNNDGLIDGVDLVGLTNFVLDTPVEGDIFWAADVVPDGVINGSDYVREVNAILGRTTLMTNAKAKAPSMDAGACAIYGNDITASAGSTVEMKVSVANQSKFTLWQSDFKLPSGVSVVDVVLGGDRTNAGRHKMMWNVLEDGTLRIMSGSTGNKEFAGNDGAVATVLLKVDDAVSQGLYTIDLCDGIVVEANETTHVCSPGSVQLAVGETTGIADLVVGDGVVDVYNVYGQVVRKQVNRSEATNGLQRGVYIVGGNKVAVK